MSDPALLVAICIPSFDQVHADFALALVDLCVQAERRGIATERINVRSSALEVGRHHLARHALAIGASHLLWLDSDMTFPADTLVRLLAHEKLIVGAAYPQRRPPHRLVGIGIEDIAPGARSLARMAIMGFGCMLTQARVFQILPPPWFAEHWEGDPAAPSGMNFVDLDANMCRQAIAAGLDVWCDLDLSHQVEHIGQQAYRWGEALQN